MGHTRPAWAREGALVLAIETSNPGAWRTGCGWSPGVALAKVVGAGVALVDEEAIDKATPQHDDLAGAIERLGTRSGVRARDLACVAVSLGPGGFTNTRVAVTTAKMLAEVGGGACVGVPTSWVVAQRVVRDGTVFSVALASKHQDAHVTRFDAMGVAHDAGTIMDAGALAALRATRLVADQHLPGAMREACRSLDIAIVEPRFEALACAEVALRCGDVDPAELAPMYPREPEAVTKWRALGREKKKEK